jgi:hypothetical protein
MSRKITDVNPFSFTHSFTQGGCVIEAFLPIGKRHLRMGCVSAFFSFRQKPAHLRNTHPWLEKETIGCRQADTLTPEKTLVSRKVSNLPITSPRFRLMRRPPRSRKCSAYAQMKTSRPISRVTCNSPDGSPSLSPRRSCGNVRRHRERLALDVYPPRNFSSPKKGSTSNGNPDSVAETARPRRGAARASRTTALAGGDQAPKS